MNTAQRQLEIRRRLEAALQPQLLEVIDEGHLHVGHAGARDGRGHFRVYIVSAQFSGRSRVQRHRLVYSAMDELMHSDVHALTIEAVAPEEAGARTD